MDCEMLCDLILARAKVRSKRVCNSGWSLNDGCFFRMFWITSAKSS